MVSFFEGWDVEVDAPQRQHSASFDTFEEALAYFLSQRDYDARVSLVFTGAEYEEE